MTKYTKVVTYTVYSDYIVHLEAELHKSLAHSVHYKYFKGHISNLQRHEKRVDLPITSDRTVGCVFLMTEANRRHNATVCHICV